MSPNASPSEPADQPADGIGADITDVRHILAILTRWRILIASGTLFVVSATVALLMLTPPAYSATSVLMIDQPLGIANGEEGLGVAQKMINLIPTYAELATTDYTLSSVKERLQIKDSLPNLRSRIDAEASEGKLFMHITARDSDARIAQDLASAVGQSVKEGIVALQAASSVPEAFQFVITEVSAPDATRPSRNELRTVLLAAAFGFAVMAALSIALEIVFERQ